MSASGRTKVASDVKFGEHISSSSTSGPNLVILALMVSKRRCRHDDGDDGGDGDGVRGLSHKRLRQLRWARALKTLDRVLYNSVRASFGLCRSYKTAKIKKLKLDCDDEYGVQLNVLHRTQCTLTTRWLQQIIMGKLASITKSIS